MKFFEEYKELVYMYLYTDFLCDRYKYIDMVDSYSKITIDTVDKKPLLFL